MNTLFLLLTGVALLFLALRYFGRVLAVGGLAPLARAPESRRKDAPATRFLDGGLEVAGSANVLAGVGIGLALTWGWAPVYVWVFVACALLAGLARAGLAFLVSSTRRDSIAAAAAAACGNAFGALLHLALVFALVVWVPVLAAAGATLAVSYPAAAAAILVQGMLAAALAPAWRRAPGPATAVVILAVVVFSLPAAIAATRWLDTGTGIPVTGAAATGAAATGIVVLALALAQISRRRFLAPFGFHLAVLLALAAALPTAGLITEPVDIAYLGYHRAVDGPGALPLLLACASLGVWPLLAAAGRARQGPIGNSLAGPTAEGLAALIVLVALLAAPTLMPGAPIVLPDWSTGIDPSGVAVYLVQTLAALAEPLPLPHGMVTTALAALILGVILVLLVNACAALGAWSAQVVAGHGTAFRFFPLAAAVVLVAYTAVFVWMGSLPVFLWLAAGEATLAFLAAVLFAAGFAARRLRRSSVAQLLSAAAVSLAFWWVVADQLVDAVAGREFARLVVQVAMSVLGALLFAAAAADWRRLAKVRSAPAGAPPSSREEPA